MKKITKDRYKESKQHLSQIPIFGPNYMERPSSHTDTDGPTISSSVASTDSPCTLITLYQLGNHEVK
ncbi:hypothetical protein DEO72_LG11g180 [Vigna unguiculata]|uniref:Uncharacterized protein n=1 Tax=Vigna unguiculata TaxID=3917 RepID=A0A4D6NMV7_VIGUN|nr:hypothetical protein DEO72_LG11g180 [Vigna unguiculata]